MNVPGILYYLRSQVILHQKVMVRPVFIIFSRSETMPMLTLKQLQYWFEDTEMILSEVCVAVRNLKRISDAKDAAEAEVLRDPFFIQFRKQLQFIIILQLCKLYVYKDSERRNLRKLFNRLRYDPYDTRLKARLKENRGSEEGLRYKAEVIRLVETQLPELEARAELIQRIRIRRDRLYAHSDPGKKLPKVTLNEMEDLARLAVKILNAIQGGMLGRSFTPGLEEGWSVEHVLNALK